MLTEASPASIFATRDWLEPNKRPRCSWVIRRSLLCFLIAPASPSLTSTSAASSSLRPRKSAELPTFHPAASSRCLLRLSIVQYPAGQFVVKPQTRPASVDHFTWRLACLLAEHFNYHGSVWISSIHNSPRSVSVDDSEFVTTASYRNYRPRMRQGKFFASLQTPEQYSGLDSAFFGKRRCLDLAMQPDQGFVFSL